MLSRCSRFAAAAVLWLACGASFAADVPSCSWDQPGANPFRGDRSEAIRSFDGMPWWVRDVLQFKMRVMPPDDRVLITKTGIESTTGKSYALDVQGMHFGRGDRCLEVTRHGWTDDHVEPASLWCIKNWCAGLPDVCGNVFWTVRQDTGAQIRADAQRRALGAQAVVGRVPEPGSLLLVALALGALVVVIRRRR